MRGMMIFLFIVFTIAAVGCGKDTRTIYVTETKTVTVKEDIPDTVQSLVDEENEYRLSQGQTMLSKGLSCSVRQVSSGQWIYSSSPGYNAGQGILVLTGTTYYFLGDKGFNQPSASGGSHNNILPSAIRPLFVNLNYKITCNGYIVVENDGYASFEMSSDDGSILTVDGAQIINNDGNHGITTKSGSKLLRRGVRSFSLSYAQSNSGSFALILKMNGAVAPATVFYH